MDASPYTAAFREWALADPKSYAQAKARGVGSPKFETSGFRIKDGATLRPDPQEYVPAPIVRNPITPQEYAEELLELISNFIIPKCDQFVKEAIEKGLAQIRENFETASASVAADFGLELIHLIGASRIPGMGLRARILKALIARDDQSLAAIAREFGVTRATASKIARELKAALPGLKIYAVTRPDTYAEQCRIRANKVQARNKKLSNNSFPITPSF